MNSNEKKPETRQNQQKRAADLQKNRPQNPRPKQTSQDTKPTVQNRPQPRSTINRQTPPQNASNRKKQSGLSDNLRSQTPLQRQLRKKNAPSEPGTVRRTGTQHFKMRSSTDKRQKHARKKTNRSFTKRVLILGLVGYIILFPIVLLAANFLLKANITTSTEDFRYQLGEGKNTLWRKTYSNSRVCRDGVYYIDMDSIAEYCKLTITGDGKNMRYVVRESSESVEFVIGESIAYINGVPERTGGNAFIYDGKVHIPLEFAKRCFINLDITLDTDKNRITIVRQTDVDGKYLALDFPYKLMDDTDKIVFGELDVEIQEQIIKQNQPDVPADTSENQTNSTQ